MSKPFNIHDWQAKQAKKRLNEEFDPSAPNSQELTLAPEIAKFIGQTFASWMSPDSPPFAQEYAKAPYFDKLVKGIMEIVNERRAIELGIIPQRSMDEGDIDEGTCGYTHTADGKKLNTPGGTKGMSALNRTNFMR